MNEITWVLDGSFWEMRFYDLPNFFVCALLSIIASKAVKISLSVQLVLLGHCCLPLFLNGVLFPFDYMPDALNYWREVNAIRSGDLSFIQASAGGNVEQASMLLTLLPLPFVMTPISLGFFNTFLYLVLFFWLYRKGIFTNTSMWFYLLYPSLSLYTGLGLRDTLVLVFMVISIQWAREGRWIAIWLPLALLFMIKFQNFFMLAPVLCLYLFFGIRQSGVSVGKGLMTLAAGVAALIVLAPIVLPLVNHFRRAMFIEDGGSADQVEFVSGPGEFVLEGLTSGVYFLLKPFPWEVSSMLQLVQSVENLVVGVFLVLLVLSAWRRAPRKLVFWLLFMAFALSIYGLVVFNYGTAARYRYPFLVIFVVFVCADCRVRSLFKPFVPLQWRKSFRRSASEGNSPSPIAGKQ